jgi:hypothetical protein
MSNFCDLVIAWILKAEACMSLAVQYFTKEKDMVNVALQVKLEAKPGKEVELESFLREQLALVQGEPETTAWFAMRLGPRTFAIFDAFPSDADRQDHLSGGVAEQLMEIAPELLVSNPIIEKIDVLAAKLPGVQEVPDSLG